MRIFSDLRIQQTDHFAACILLLSVPAHAFRGHDFSLLVAKITLLWGLQFALFPLESAPTLQATKSIRYTFLAESRLSNQEDGAADTSQKMMVFETYKSLYVITGSILLVVVLLTAILIRFTFLFCEIRKTKIATDNNN